MTEMVVINIDETPDIVTITESSIGVQPFWGEILGDIENQSDLVTELSDASRLSIGVIDGDILPPITSNKKGSVPPTSVPSGKFLRDDNTWGVPDAGGVTWGNISGNISNQLDLVDEFENKADVSDLSNHIGNTNNPHSVTKTQVGLSNVPNTDTTNAGNISSGTLDGDRLPSISTTKKGGVPATGTVTGKYLADDGNWTSFSNVIPVLDKSSGNYNLALSDANSFQNITTATVVTIKLDDVVDIPIGSSVIFYRNTSGAVSLAKDVGVILNSEYGLILNEQYSVAGIIKIAANSWVCFGSLKAS